MGPTGPAPLLVGHSASIELGGVVLRASSKKVAVRLALALVTRDFLYLSLIFIGPAVHTRRVWNRWNSNRPVKWKLLRLHRLQLQKLRKLRI